MKQKQEHKRTHCVEDTVGHVPSLYNRMDELEQKCYDLDTKVRRVEEERDAVMHENDELNDQISTLKTLIEGEIGWLMLPTLMTMLQRLVFM